MNLDKKISRMKRRFKVSLMFSLVFLHKSINKENCIFFLFLITVIINIMSGAVVASYFWKKNGC